MGKLDYWRLCDELTVVQAALLIVGCLPEESANVEAWSPEQQPDGYPAVRAALTSAILSQALDASIRRRAWVVGWTEDHDPIGFDDADPKITFGQLSHVVFERGSTDIFGSPARQRGGAKPPAVAFRADPDWNLTTVKVAALRNWLAARGMVTGFFFSPSAPTAAMVNDVEVAQELSRLRAEVARLQPMEPSLAAANAERQRLLSECANLTSGAERLLGERYDLAAKVDAVQQEIAQGKGKTTMLKIIGGMAIGGWGADIHGQRITGLTEILSDLARAGVSIDENTLRGRLREAAEHVPKKK